MKVSIGSKIIDGPWGGGNLFVKNLSEFLLKNDFTAKPDIELQYKNVLKYFIADGMKPFVQMFRGLHES